MFDARDALMELTGVLPRSVQGGEVLNLARSYSREMHVLTVLQRTGDVEPITLNVLSTVWNRLKGAGGTTFERLTAKLWKEAPTVIEYGEANNKRTSAYCVKLKGMLAFASEWEYDGQDGMATAKDYQRVPTPGWTVLSKHSTSKCSSAWHWRKACICAPQATSMRSTLRRSTAHQETPRGTSRTRSSKPIA